MFERNLLADHQRSRLAETGDGLALRRLDWAELVARVRASRDCREAIGRDIAPIGGGFAQFRTLAVADRKGGKLLVNRSALSNGSIDGPDENAALIETASGDRGN